MSRSIYALVVGIDNYKSPTIPPLRGCVNDVTAIDEFFQKHLTNNEDKFYIKKLINHEATRQGIIDAFRKHLCQARSNDIALFYFSGHGSQEYAAKEFWNLEPDHLHETLVCWDSRTDGIWDLADKELAKLLAEVSQNHPHVVVILDCCHSGGGTRSEGNISSVEYTGIRSVDIESVERPLANFIFSSEEIKSLRSRQNRDDKTTKIFSLAQGEYILLAACRDSEQAREHQSQKRGVFSYFLLDSLLRNSNLTYRDLLKRTNVLVRSFYPNQSPQIEATNSRYLDQSFLGVSIAKRQMYFTVFYDGSNGWSIDGGAIHGIIPSKENQKTRLAIFPINLENITQLKDAIAVAEVVEVLPQLSRINISGEREESNPELIYKAVITSLGVSSLKVYLEGEEVGVNFARQAIQTASFGESSSLYICEVENFQDADFYLQALNNEYSITRVSDKRQLISTIIGFSPESALQAIHTLEHIARWINIATITSPANSLIPTDAVQMHVYQQDSEIQDYQIYVQYQVNSDGLQPPAIRIKLTNTSDTKLYCVLLDLTELFAVKAISFAGGFTGIWLEPGQEVWALEGKNIPIFIPQKLLKSGVKEYKDILKLIASTSEFDVNLLVQDNIETLNKRDSNLTSLRHDNVHNKLVQQMQSRAIVAYPDEPQQPEILHDWMASEMLIITVVPKQVTQHNLPIKSEKTYENNNLFSKFLFKNLKVNLIFIFVFVALLFGWIVWYKLQQGKSEKQRISYDNGFSILEKFPQPYCYKYLDSSISSNNYT